MKAIDYKQAQGLFNRTGKRLEAAVERGLVSGSQRVRKLMLDRTRTAAPRGAAAHASTGAFNTGTYLRSWKAEAIGTTRSAYSSPAALAQRSYRANSVVARTFNDAPYAGVIEFGRRPGKGVSISGQQMLAAWIQRKLKVGRGKSRSAAAELKSAVFLIARAIKRRGMPGRYVMTGAKDQIVQLTKEGIAFELARASRGPK